MTCLAARPIGLSSAASIAGSAACTSTVTGARGAGARARAISSKRNCATIETRMTDSDRALLVELRKLLLELHKTLIDWQRTDYERVRGRLQTSQLLNVMFNDPEFAWLRSMSGLIVRIELRSAGPPSRQAAGTECPRHDRVRSARRGRARSDRARSRIGLRAALSCGAAGAAGSGAGAPRSRRAVEAAAAGV